MSHHPTDVPQFYLTSPSPCPYLDGQKERKIFTNLVGARAGAINDVLTQGGFRRSQNIAYRPACEFCRACLSIRVCVDDFDETRSFKRINKLNRFLVDQEIPPTPTSEQYALFRHYLDARHETGGMADMTVMNYSLMVEDTHVSTIMVEYREPTPDSSILGYSDGPLVAVALTDVLSDGLSMVYSFFDTRYDKNSLGTFMILDHIRRARERGLPYLYLGYWVKGSQKMSYKTRFKPHQILTPSGWERQGD